MSTPVTLTFQGATLTLARQGDLVTALVEPTGGPMALSATPQPIPAGMRPAGNAVLYLLTDPTFTAPNSYQISVDGPGYFGASGIAVSRSAGTGPYPSFTAQWQADPAPAVAIMSSELAEFFVHTVTVETYQGVGSLGDVFAAPVTVAAFVEDTRRLVRDKNGEQVVSETTLYTYLTNAALFTTNSRVTVAGAPARAARVIRQNANDGGPLDLPDHLAVALT